MLGQLLNNILVRLLAIGVLTGFLARDVKAGISFIVVLAINIWVFYLVRSQAQGVLAKTRLRQARLRVPPLEQQVVRSTLRFLPVLFIAELALLAIAGQAGLSVNSGFSYAAALLAAALPCSLALTQWATVRVANTKDSKVLLRNAAHNTASDNASMAGVVIISLAATAIWHTALALGTVELLTFSLLLQLLPYIGLADDTKPHVINEPRRVTAGFSLLTAGLAYTNFIFYFLRNGLSPRHVDASNPYYMKATAAALLTLVICQGLHLLFTRSHTRKRFFAPHLWTNRWLWLGFGLSLFVFVNMLYDPIVRPFFGCGPLSLTDWLWAVVAGGIYMTAKLIQRHTRQHTHAAVLELHRSKQA